MRVELIIGVLVSAILHAGFLFGEQLIPKRIDAPKVVVQEEESLQIEMPPLEPEPEEVVEELPDEQPTNQLAPPSLVDMPMVVPVDAFVQQMQPPPPPGLEVAKGAVSIPVTRPGTNFGKGMKDLFDIANLDQIPVARLRVNPTYPFDLKRNSVEGYVTVEFIVTSSGDVLNAHAIDSSNLGFEQAAIDAVMKWKFRPGRKGGRAVNTNRVQQRITFTLNQS